ncbi:MAG: YkgJ family cysteine cluster protein [Candidatus Hodarchaeota archaeon]
MNFTNIKHRYLENDHDDSTMVELRSYSRGMQDFTLGELEGEISRILEKPLDFMESVRQEREPVNLGDVQFTCDGCGKGCQRFTIGLSIHDLARFIRDGFSFVLPFVTLYNRRPVFKLFSKREFKGVEMIYPPKLVDHLKSINPALDRLDGDHLDGCVFFNDATRKCTIYEQRPIECRLYPVGNILNGSGNIICDEGCFENAQPVDEKRFQELYDKKRVSDVAFTALYDLNPQRGWRQDVFKLSLLFDQIAYTIWQE